jgi:rhodanese-related sulfurtransferase
MLNKDLEVILYCGSYTCSLSPRAAHILTVHLGFTKVLDYKDGFKSWKDSGYPVEK